MPDANDAPAKLHTLHLKSPDRLQQQIQMGHKYPMLIYAADDHYHR